MSSQTTHMNSQNHYFQAKLKVFYTFLIVNAAIINYLDPECKMYVKFAQETKKLTHCINT